MSESDPQEEKHFGKPLRGLDRRLREAREAKAATKTIEEESAGLTDEAEISQSPDRLKKQLQASSPRGRSQKPLSSSLSREP